MTCSRLLRSRFSAAKTRELALNLNRPLGQARRLVQDQRIHRAFNRGEAGFAGHSQQRNADTSFAESIASVINGACRQDTR